MGISLQCFFVNGQIVTQPVFIALNPMSSKNILVFSSRVLCINLCDKALLYNFFVYGFAIRANPSVPAPTKINPLKNLVSSKLIFQEFFLFIMFFSIKFVPHTNFKSIEFNFFLNPSSDFTLNSYQ